MKLGNITARALVLSEDFEESDVERLGYGQQDGEAEIVLRFRYQP